MRTETIETLFDWNTLARILRELDYAPWQYQFDIDCPEGFQTRFRDHAGKEILVITHCAEVHDAIFEYQSD